MYADNPVIFFTERSVAAAEEILYQEANFLIRPVLQYCYPIYLSIGESAKKNLQSIQGRTRKIIAPTNNRTLEMDTLDQVRKNRLSIDVFKASLKRSRHFTEHCSTFVE